MSKETAGPEQPDGHASSHEPGTREHILAAGRELFTGKGFDAVSIREIAEDAGVNSALIYYYFQDKEELYRQVLESVFGRLLQRIQHKLGRGEGSPEAMLRNVAGRYMHFIEENQGSLKLMYYELAREGRIFRCWQTTSLRRALLRYARRWSRASKRELSVPWILRSACFL